MSIRIYQMTMGLLATLTVLLVGCGKEEPEVRTYRLSYPSDVEGPKAAPTMPGLPKDHPPTAMPKPGPSAAPASTAQKPWKWSVPTGWTEGAGGGMRLASFTVNGVSDLDVSIIVLGAAAGGLGPNVNRWRGQIGLKAQSDEEILKAMKAIRTSSDQEALVCDLRGDGAEKAIRAGIIRTESETVFLKMIGPADDVGAAAGAFDALVASMEKL